MWPVRPLGYLMPLGASWLPAAPPSPSSARRVVPAAARRIVPTGRRAVEPRRAEYRGETPPADDV